MFVNKSVQNRREFAHVNIKRKVKLLTHSSVWTDLHVALQLAVFLGRGDGRQRRRGHGADLHGGPAKKQIALTCFFSFAKHKHKRCHLMFHGLRKQAHLCVERRKIRQLGFEVENQ